MRVNVTNNEAVKLKNTIANDAQIRALLTASHAQIDAWVDNNVNSLADAKSVFKKILKIILFLIRTKMKEWKIDAN
jgi:hypothetical protein